MKPFWLVLFLLCAAFADAQAKCAGPQAVLAPAAGSALPENAVLHLFWPRWRGAEPKLIAHGPGRSRPTIAQREVSRTPAFTVYELKLGGAPPGSLRLELVGAKGSYIPTQSFSYVIDPSWQAPSQRDATPRIHEAKLRWTCSYQLSQNLTLAVPGAAFRLVIANSEADYRAGRTQSLIVPRRMDLFFTSGAAPASGKASDKASAAEIQLGHSNCIGATFVWQAQPIYVGLFALHEDGSQSALNSQPLRVEPPTQSTNKEGAAQPE